MDDRTRRLTVLALFGLASLSLGGDIVLAALSVAPLPVLSTVSAACVGGLLALLTPREPPPDHHP